jgi:hypothetical protein
MTKEEDFITFKARHHSGKKMERIIFGNHLTPEEMMDILEEEG